MQPITSETLDSFFDTHVRRLHEKGVFRTFDEPMGEALEGVHPYAKASHEDDSDFPIGMVGHKGDVPYDKAISSDHPMSCAFVPVNQKMVNLKTQSVQDAIAHYVPPTSFTTYLRYFAENLDNPEIQSYILASLENMKDQLSILDPNRPISAETVEALLSHNTTKARTQDPVIQEGVKKGVSAFSFEDGSPNMIPSVRMVNNLMQTEYQEEAYQYPELLLSMAIFQGAHIGYKAELEKSIHRQHKAGILSDEEHQNSIAVIKGALVQFEDFVLFSTLVPIVLHEHAKLTGQQQDELPARNTPEGMRHAITRGGERFLEARVLNSVMSAAPAQGGTPEEFAQGRLNMVCPAKQHLATMLQAGVPEMLYDRVQQHRDKLEPYLSYTEKAASNSSNGEPQTSFFSASPFPKTPSEASCMPSEWDLGEGYFTQEEARKLAPVGEELSMVLRLPNYDRYSRFRWNMMQFTQGITIKPAPVAGKTGYMVVDGSFATVDTSFLNIRQACELVEEQLKKLPERKANRLREQFRDALPERARVFMPDAPKSGKAEPDPRMFGKVVTSVLGAVPEKQAKCPFASSRENGDRGDKKR